MNKILYIARKSKGFTEAQLAQVLGMSETEYNELECELRQMPLDIALKAAKLFNLTPDYFLVSEKQSAKLRAYAAKEALELLSSPDLENVPAQLGARFIALGTRALVLQEELNAALHENHVLRRENEVLRQLNADLRPQQEDNSNS
ncbi:helix-turn-helix transcriptional regulator [Mucilaginibacter sp. PAMB04168]|uniref:helix-turn-helix transcriptional regulator n=1 Tax=Mucilaginibacter sp. PAMB04168 TaxID=3138567 RepID=UPI0031F70C2B